MFEYSNSLKLVEKIIDDFNDNDIMNIKITPQKYPHNNDFTGCHFDFPNSDYSLSIQTDPLCCNDSFCETALLFDGSIHSNDRFGGVLRHETAENFKNYLEELYRLITLPLPCLKGG